MDNSLPVFDLQIDSELDSQFEVNYVALVDKPAIKKDWMAFNETNKLYFSGDDEMIVIGAAMIPDMLIYRNDETLGEFYARFSKETIAQIALKFFEKGFQKNVNLMHDPEVKLSGVTFFQSFIKDTEKGVLGLAGDYPEGTWFLGAKITDPTTWQFIKDGKVRGFSVEGIFKYKPKKLMAEETFEQIKRLLENYL